MKTRIISLIAGALLPLLFAGCNSGSSVPHRSDSPASIASPQGMIAYLCDLPALKRAEEWENPYGPGLILTTENYQVYTTLMDPLMLRQIPAFLESAHREYQKVAQSIKTETPFVIYLFKSRKQWETFTEEFTGDQASLYLKIKRGAYYLNGACVTYNIGRSRTFSVLGHEGWHQFNSRHFAYRLPSWVDEGLATLFESSTFVNNQFVFTPSYNLGRLGALRKALIDNRTMPLKTLLALNPGEVVHYEDSDSVMAFYAQNYALVRFLRENNYGQRLAAFQSMLNDGIDGKWPLSSDERRIASNRNIPFTSGWNRYVSPKLFKHYIENDIDLLQSEYDRFCRKIVHNIRLK